MRNLPIAPSTPQANEVHRLERNVLTVPNGIALGSFLAEENLPEDHLEPDTIDGSASSASGD